MNEDVSPKPAAPSTYLGDAVYASFDGDHIWLHLNDHRSPGLIALEPQVVRALVAFYRSLGGEIT